ncbi:MAG: hypothetical protein U1E78_13655 [Gammaproteobacteria bacterium]
MKLLNTKEIANVNGGTVNLLISVTTDIDGFTAQCLSELVSASQQSRRVNGDICTMQEFFTYLLKMDMATVSTITVL